MASRSTQPTRSTVVYAGVDSATRLPAPSTVARMGSPNWFVSVMVSPPARANGISTVAVPPSMVTVALGALPRRRMASSYGE
jgi:hypothetical protein